MDALSPGFSLKLEQSRCKHLYFYYVHKKLGFKSVCLQTWALYSVQIAIKGRQWLRRQLDREGIPYILEGNKFLHIDDYARAQSVSAGRKAPARCYGRTITREVRTDEMQLIVVSGKEKPVSKSKSGFKLEVTVYDYKDCGKCPFKEQNQ